MLELERPPTDEGFWEFCAALPKHLRIERERNGTIVIYPPGNLETGCRVVEVTCQLGEWAKRDARGIAMGSCTDYFLRDGSARGPHAAWVLKARLAQFSRKEKRRFLHLCPDFVVELKSPSDRLTRLKAKMEEWIENGAQLGLLIDPETRTVYIYRPGTKPEELKDADSVAGEGPVAGFVLDLGPIWRGL
jgi:Uma2 family endonuclease